MEKINLSQANQTYLNNKKNTNDTATSSTNQNEQINDGAKKIKLALAALAIAGTAIAAGVAIYKHKNPSKGIEEGAHKVATTKNGQTSSVIIEDLQNADKKSQNELKTLPTKKDNLSIKESQKQADEIEFKPKNEAEKTIEEAKEMTPAEKHRLEAEQKRIAEQENAKEILEKYNIEYNKGELADIRLGVVHDITNTGNITNENKTVICNHGRLRTNNSKYREGKEDLASRLADRAFENLKPLEEDAIVYRGLSADTDGMNSQGHEFIKSLLEKKKGEIVTDNGYAYASYNKQITNQYAGAGSQDNYIGARMIIKVPKGAKVSRAKTSRQSEMLFPRKAQFKVLETAQEKDGIAEILLEYILPKT